MVLKVATDPVSAISRQTATAVKLTLARVAREALAVPHEPSAACHSCSTATVLQDVTLNQAVLANE